MSKINKIVFAVALFLIVGSVNALEIGVNSADSVNINDIINVTIEIPNEVDVWQFDLDYDQSKLSLVNGLDGNTSTAVSTSALNPQRKYYISFRALTSGNTTISLKNILAYSANNEEEQLNVGVTPKNITVNLHGLINQNNNTYYYVNGVMQTGWQYLGNDTYYFKDDGTMYKGVLLYSNGKRYFLDENSGHLLRDKFITSSGIGEGTASGAIYYTNSDGVLRTDWQYPGNDVYYFDEDGTAHRGVLEYSNGKKYFLDENSGRLVRDGIVTSNGFTYYTNGDGVIRVDWQYIGDSVYYFNEDGTMYKGILEYSNGRKYYLDENSGLLLRNTLITSNGTGTGTASGAIYYTNSDGVLRTDWQYPGNDVYYFDEDGTAHRGILEYSNGKKYFLDENSGRLVRDGIVTSNGFTYYTNSDGVIRVNWQYPGNDVYYFNANGTMYKGILEYNNGKKYYLDENSGRLIRNGFITSNGTGTGTINGAIYYVNGDGVVQTDWQYLGNDTYYFSANGTMYKGILLYSNGKKYFLDENSGHLIRNSFITSNGTGTGTVNGAIYYVDSDGIVQTGNKFINGFWYKFDANGVLQTGWQVINDINYYFNENGTPYRGILEKDGRKYFFEEDNGYLVIDSFVTSNGKGVGTKKGATYYTNSDGVIRTDWQYPGSDTYYFNEDGTMYKGILLYSNGKKYFLDENSGRLVRSHFVTSNGTGTGTVNGAIYYTDSDGIVQTGDKYIEGRWYKFDANGVLQSGWQTINGNSYYFNTDGSVVTGVAKIAGVRYLFNSSGALLNSNVKQYIDVSKHQGQIDWDTLWNSGEIDGAILQIGFGSAYNQLDAWFLYNLAAVNRLNIPFTVYVYSYAETYDEAIWEADNLFSWLTNHNVIINSGLPIYIDIEEFGNSPESISKYCTVIPTFVSRMNSYGLGAAAYTYANIARNLPENVRNYVDWIANYTSDNDYEYNWRGWQYTSDGSVSGFNGRVDLSVFK